MSGVPNRLQQGTDYQAARPLINDNFDKVASDVTALGAAQTSTVLFNSGSVATNTTWRQTVAIVNPGGSSSYPYMTAQTAIPGVSAIVPSIDIYVDVDGDIGYLYPLGQSLTSSSRALAIDVKLDLTPVSSPATLTVSGRNYDGSSHTYYIHMRCTYFASKSTGIQGG